MKNIRIYCLLLMLLCFKPTIAQNTHYKKLSPLVREAIMDNTLQLRRMPHSPNAWTKKVPQITAFVKIEQNADNIFKQYGCQKLSEFGNIYIVSIPINRLKELSENKNVQRIEAGRRSQTQMDTTAMVVNATSVHSGINLPQAYTGKGVIVGVQDVGFDLTHPTFYSEDMNTYRVKALWDQLAKDTIASNLFVGKDYTTESALLTIQHSYDGFIETHGTHTAGIAAGSGAEGNGNLSPYRGIAYDADLVFVSNAVASNASLIDSTDYYKYTYATDALGFKYIFDYAKKVGKPCVINFSEGSHQDFMGYDQLYYTILDSITGPGRIIVASAGNDAGFINHIEKPKGLQSAGSFIVGNMKSVHITIKSDNQYSLKTKIYKDKASPVSIEIPISSVLQAPDSVYSITKELYGDVYKWDFIAYNSSYNKNDLVCDIRISSTSALGHTIPVSIELENKDAHIEAYRIAGYLTPSDYDPTLNAGDNTYSIHSPSSAPSVICVGATAYRTQFENYLGEIKVYNNGTDGVRAPFSGVGPTLDGRTKPDIMAPGQNIISSYSTFYINNPQNAGAKIASDISHFTYNGKTYAWNANGGTSMSAPVVTGAIALWLEAYPKLSPKDCIEVFRKTATRYNPTLTYPNNEYGYGQIDVLEGLKEVLKLKSVGIENIELVSTTNDTNYYYIDGRYAGKDYQKLKKGVYIHQNKKFIKQ